MPNGDGVKRRNGSIFFEMNDGIRSCAKTPDIAPTRLAICQIAEPGSIIANRMSAREFRAQRSHLSASSGAKKIIVLPTMLCGAPPELKLTWPTLFG